jgi:hypothetical protein
MATHDKFNSFCEELVTAMKKIDWLSNMFKQDNGITISEKQGHAFWKFVQAQA